MTAESNANPDLIHLDDRRVRLLLVPVLGIAIAGATGLYRGVQPLAPFFWIATAYFILVSFLIWEGNRQFWARLRGKPDWLDRPLLRLTLLGLTSFSWTVFASVTLLLIWQRLSGLPAPDWKTIETTTFVTVLSVAVIVHSYETAYLIRQRRRDRGAHFTLQQAKARAELAALNAQVDPHFVFNSLNTIIELNDENPALATEFTLTLAEVYRYVVLHGNRDLVSLAEEFAFLEKYASLLRTRFGDGIRLRAPAPAPHHKDLRVPPVSLQILLENAVKHNRFTDAAPIRIEVELKGRTVIVTNEKRPLSKPARGAGTGLTNLDQRCKLICGPGIEIRDGDETFAVVVPLL